MSTVKDKKQEVNTRMSRFSDAPWYKPGIKTILGGVGGIGSWLALLLSRQGNKLFLFDFDHIDESNMAGQLYRTKDIGSSKADTMKDLIMEFSANSNVTVMGKYDEDSFTGNIVFSAFDNMSARKLMFSKWKEYALSKESEGKPVLFVDGRLLAEDYKIFAVTRRNISEYEKYLWDDSEIEDLPCSFKATSHCSAAIAGMMVAIYNNFLTNVVYKTSVREVPFLTELELPTLTFTKTKI